MNISGNSTLIHPAESPFKQFQPLNGLRPSATGNPAIAKSDTVTLNLNEAAPGDILSAREKETLQALFNGSARERTFYGATKVGNIQSGFLLDIKG